MLCNNRQSTLFILKLYIIFLININRDKGLGVGNQTGVAVNTLALCQCANHRDIAADKENILKLM